MLLAAYLQMDILGLAGASDAGSLVLRAGRMLNVVNTYAVSTGLIGAGTYAYSNDSGIVDSRIGASLTYTVASIPLYVNTAGDLDMWSANGKGNGSNSIDAATKDTGYAGLAEIGLDNMNIADTIELGVNAFGIFHNYVTNVGLPIAGGNLKHTIIGGSLGVGILGLPVNLKVGGSYEQAFVNQDGQKVNGFAASAGVRVGMDDIFTVGVNFAHLSDKYQNDSNINIFSGSDRAGVASVLGLDFTYEGLSFMKPYLDVAFAISTYDNREVFESNGNADKLAWELGIDFPIPSTVGSFDVITGWQRGFANNNADEQVHGLGSFFVTFVANM
jgi:hypothetical protein